MAYETIPEDISEFILQHIDSIAELEGLLIFHLDPQKNWTAEALAGELYIDKSQAETLLRRLVERGFITERTTTVTTYQYQHVSENLTSTVTRVADIYRQFLVPITHLIHSKPKSKVQQFADAFKIRKD
ncbi:MAG: hypothetical protein EB060_06030 [Proteobacteria bacterium]|nr:hypothetical protein [Pseudomonadota bacterium]